MEKINEKHLKGYELIERIGAGGFGAVYKAYQSTIGREVAIKVILPGFANHPDFIRRFETEAHVIARLEHPYIVPLYDYWRDPEGAYLVMRWLRGGSLREKLKQSGALTVDEANMILTHICSGLELAHRHDVIHRDIKPGNILLDEDGNAYLADFGIAKDLTSYDTNHTGLDEIVGSLEYLSPEQARSEPVSPATDVYSLGVMLFEMLAGQHPFYGSSAVELLYKHINDPLPELTVLDLTIRNAVNDVIQKATQKNPVERYQDALSFANDFRKAINATDHLATSLTQREYDVLRRIVDGLSNQQIADELFIALSTVKTYVNQIYKKLGVRTRVQATLRSHELNLLSAGVGQEITSLSSSYLPEPENPYKGLQAFEAHDSRDFFGREQLIEKLIRKMQDGHSNERFLAVIGPSGSGKSSLVKGGLIPAIWNGQIPGSDRWYTIEMMPGDHPIEELEVALTRISANQVANLDEHLRRDHRGLLRASKLILPSDDTELLIVIDQFEELFTHVDDEDERQHFLDMLYTAVTDSRSHIRVIVTLRADFYDRPLHYPDFGDLLRSRMETILPLSAKELHRAIEKPAERVLVTFEEGLVAHIVSEMNYQSGALPLLQYALTELFENRQGRLLTHEAYQTIGGAVGALTQRAESLFEELNPEQQKITQQMFLRLVTPGEGTGDTRRRVPRSELLAISDEADIMNDLIDLFAKHRMLSLDNDLVTHSPTVEVAHESILGQWERLRNWINQNREEIKVQQQISHLTEEWHNANQDPSYLVRGLRLDQMLDWAENTDLALTETERDFLRASLDDRKQRKQIEEARKDREIDLERRSVNNLRALVITFVIASVVSTLFAVVAYTQRITAENARATSEILARDVQNQADVASENLLVAQNTQALFLADLAQQQLSTGNPGDALHLAIESVNMRDDNFINAESHQALFDSLVYFQAQQAVYIHEDELNGAMWNADESQILTWSKDGSARILDAFSDELLFTTHHESAVRGAMWNADESQILTWSVDGTARIWDISSSDLLFTAQHENSVFGALWNTDESQILTWSVDGTARIWDIATGNSIFTAQHIRGVSGALWNADESQILTWSADNTARIWDIATGNNLFTAQHANIVSGALWNADESQILTWSTDGTAQIWDIITGNSIFTAQHEGNVSGAMWNGNESQILTWSHDRTAKIWGVDSGELLFAIQHDATVWGATWNSADTQLLSWSRDGVVQLWDITTNEQVFFAQHEDFVRGASLNVDETQVLTWGDNNIARVWDISSGNLIFIAQHEANVSGAVWNNDGSQILTWSKDGTARVWNMKNSDVLFTAQHEDFVHGAIWSADESQILTWALNGNAHTWDLASGELIFVAQDGDDHDIWGANWSVDGNQFLTWSNDNIARIWDIPGGELQFSFPHRRSDLNAPVWDENEGQILSWIDDMVQVRDIASGEVLYTIQHDDEVIGAMWNSDKSQILTWSADFVVRVWDIDTGDLLFTAQHERELRSAIWNSDESQILTVSHDNSARIWSASTGDLLFTAQHGNRSFGAGWNADESRLLTWSDDGTARIWDTVSSEAIFTAQHESGVGIAIWNSDESQILIISGDGIVRVWDIASGDILFTARHENFVNGATWNADESLILTWSWDGTARIWDIVSGEPVFTAQHDDAVFGAEWNADETRLLTRSDDGTARVWLLNIEQLLAIAGEKAIPYLFTDEDRERFFLLPTEPTQSSD